MAPTKQPLFRVIALLIIGVILGRFVELPIWAMLLAGWVICLISWFSRTGQARLLPALLILCGAVNVSIHRQIVSPVDLRTLASEADELVTLQGRVKTVTQKPALESVPTATPRYAVQIDLSHIQAYKKDWQQVHGRLIASVDFAGAEEITPGQTIQLFGILSHPPGPYAPGMFSYQQHLANRAIYFLLRSEERSDLVILRQVDRPLIDGFQKWAMSALGNSFDADDQSIQLLWAMCLGWRTALTDDVAEPFMQSGTMHLFAISGLHVALIAAILIGVLRLIRISRVWSGAIIIPLLWFYTAATGWQSSAIRSTIMMSVILFAWSLRRPTDLINTLSAAALIILLWDPNQLFQAGFQLSFAVVGTIALTLPHFEKWQKTSWFSDPFLPNELRPMWKRAADQAARFGVTALTVSFAAWLGALPLIMYYFNLFTPVSLIANVVVVQFGAGALASAAGSLICAPLIPIASELFNHSAWLFMTLMINTSVWFSELPYAWAYTKAPPAHVLIAYYLGLIVLLTSPKWFPRHRRHVFTALSGALITVSLWNQNHSRATVTLLPLNGGHAVFAERVAGQNWLIDCGDAMNYEYRTREFLKTRGLNRLDNFFITHGDIRHMGAATNLISQFQPKQIYINPSAQRSVSFRALHSFADENRVELKAVEDGDEVKPWKIVHPQAEDRFSKADAGTVILQLGLDDESILFCNDLNPEGQKALTDRHPDLTTDTIIISPNSDHRSIHPTWLDLFRPTTVIIADSDYPATEQTPVSHKELLRRHFPEVRFVSEEGTIEIILND